MQFRRTKKSRSILDMSPLIDCVLQLLIFFMLSSTFASPKIEIALPRGSTPDGATENDAVIVSAGPGGEIYIDQERVEKDRLYTVLKAVLETKENKRVTFRGDREISYQTFFEVLKAARRAGADHLDLAHATPDGQSTAEGGNEKRSEKGGP